MHIALINALLPPELLGEIFKLYMHMCTEYFRFEVYSISSQESPYRWYRVASVCRYWHSVALSMTELFTYVDLTRPKSHLTSKWLARSRQAPLRIVGRLTCTNNRWKAALPHLQRVVSLRVYTQLYSRFPLGPTLPNLKSLSYTYMEPHNPQPSDEALKGLLDRSPNLESLAIHLRKGGGSAWMSHISHRFLTRLRIYGWQGRSVPWQSNEEENREGGLSFLVPLIRRLPQLDVLELDASKFISNPSLNDLYRSHLSPQVKPLTYFKATGDLTSIVSVLTSGAIAPRKLDISVFQSMPPLHDEDIELISSAIITTPSIPWHVITSASIGIDTDTHKSIYEFSLKGWSQSIPSIMHESTDSSPVLNITIRTWYNEGHDVGFKLLLALTSAFSAVRSVSIYLPAEESTSDITLLGSHFYDKFKHLRDLDMPEFVGPLENSTTRRIWLSRPV
ncbi:hypothetical protein QCA50_011094 [Cerrena zonata]|uniref:F-box domain-containing protein n=1 Tax=Cerrena zonata TaxID=2478898 RepID=A0AAW0FW65_9APHY